MPPRHLMLHERREDKQAGQRYKFQNVPPWHLQKQRTGEYQYGTPTAGRTNGLFLEIITQLREAADKHEHNKMKEAICRIKQSSHL